MAILFLVILFTAKNRSHYSRMHSSLRDVMVHSWKAVTQVLSFSFMTRITRNRCLLMGFAKWMSFSYQNSRSQRVFAVLMKTSLSLNRKSRMKMKLHLRVLRLNVRMKKVNVKMDGMQDKDKLECEKEWVVFQEESESDISEKEMEREEERNSKDKVKASGPYFILKIFFVFT